MRDAVGEDVRQGKRLARCDDRLRVDTLASYADRDVLVVGQIQRKNFSQRLNSRFGLKRPEVFARLENGQRDS